MAVVRDEDDELLLAVIGIDRPLPGLGGERREQERECGDEAHGLSLRTWSVPRE
jgi:hypothetical protein